MAENLENLPHILSSRQYGPEDYEEHFEHADYMREAMAADSNAVYESGTDGRRIRIVNLFYEPSTRTSFSFQAAADNLGMPLMGSENAGQFSSAAKGETIEDTIRTVSKYGHIAVLRHPEAGAAERAAAVGAMPIINAGDGGNEHPTQTKLDLYTIKREKGTIEGHKYVVGGDLLYGRTIRSLLYAVSHYDDVEVTGVSLPDFRLKDDLKDYLQQHGVRYTETEDMYEALRDADVVYWSRTQLERLIPKDVRRSPEELAALATLEKIGDLALASGGMSQKKAAKVINLIAEMAAGELSAIRAAEIAEKESRANDYVVDETALQVMKKDAILLHPFPRVKEISTHVDNDPRAKYFDQAENGVYTRMADLEDIRKFLRTA